MIPSLFQVDPRDNVATALRDLAAGEQALGVAIAQPVQRGHKVALKDIAAGEPVLKFGFPIGRATRRHRAGRTCPQPQSRDRAGELRRVSLPASGPTRRRPPARRRFQGYRRADGRVGTRNEIWIIPTVGCVARTAQKIAERAASRHAGRVDGVHAFVHPFGCSQLGDDLAGTRAVLAALASHPNAGGVLIVGLGCESNQMKALLAEVDPAANVRTLGAQEAGDEIEEGLALVDALVERRRRGRSASRCRFPSWCSASNAAARTASPASPPIRWSGG